jgi:3-oxoacyl-[acyl-carrier protein] reductase
MKLLGKVSIITGGGSGMGRAISLLFAREGSRVVIADVNVSGAEETAQRAKAAGDCEVLVVPTDVSKEDQVQALVERALEKAGRLDILVNCAGRTNPLGLERADQITLLDWENVLSVNLTGPFLCTKYAAPAMRQQGGGVIINVASTAGLRPFPGITAYCVSKAGLIMLTKATALEYVSSNIRVNALLPGTVDTPMIDAVIASLEARGVADARQVVHTGSSPMRRLARPDEVAAAALFLASDDSSYVTGTELLVDGGSMVR